MSKNELAQKKNTIAELFESRKNQIAAALPSVGITTDRMVRLVFSAINQNPKLLQCNPQSLFNSMIQCASLGLEPNTRLGQAYLIPFGNDVQLIIGYTGYISLARRAGELASLNAHVVREGDTFEYCFGTEEKIKHIPNYDNFEDRKKKITFAYSVARFKDGTVSFEIMSRAEIEDIRKRSKTPNNGPWITDFEMMARKTVIRRHMHYIPLSTTKLVDAAAIDGQNEAGIQDMSGIIDIEATEAEDGSGHKEGSLEAMAEAEDNPAPEPPKKDESKQPEMVADIQAKVGEMFQYDEVKMNGYLSSITPLGMKKLTVQNLMDMTEAQARSTLGMVYSAHNEWLKRQ